MKNIDVSKKRNKIAMIKIDKHANNQQLIKREFSHLDMQKRMGQEEAHAG